MGLWLALQWANAAKALAELCYLAWRVDIQTRVGSEAERVWDIAATVDLGMRSRTVYASECPSLSEAVARATQDAAAMLRDEESAGTET